MATTSVTSEQTEETTRIIRTNVVKFILNSGVVSAYNTLVPKQISPEIATKITNGIMELIEDDN